MLKKIYCALLFCSKILQSFKCNKSIQLVGLGLYGRASSSQPNAKTCVIVSTYEEVAQLTTFNKTIPLPAEGGVFKVYLDSPIPIDENVWYTIAITMEVR